MGVGAGVGCREAMRHKTTGVHLSKVHVEGFHRTKIADHAAFIRGRDSGWRKFPIFSSTPCTVFSASVCWYDPRSNFIQAARYEAPRNTNDVRAASVAVDANDPDIQGRAWIL